MTPYYEDDLVQLFHGDCREVTAWLEADVLVTDPPYGIAWTRNGINRVSRADRQAGRYSRHARSSESDAGIANDTTTEARDAALAMWGNKPAFVFGSLLLPPPAGAKQCAVYVKPLDSGHLTAVAGVRRDVEAIYLLGNHRTGGGGRSAVFKTNARSAGGGGDMKNPTGLSKRYGHPHAKPQDVLEELIGLAQLDASVADPFAGSGSTLVAAKALGRKAIGVELEERYCEIAARRLAQDTLFGGGAA